MNEKSPEPGIHYASDEGALPGCIFKPSIGSLQLAVMSLSPGKTGAHKAADYSSPFVFIAYQSIFLDRFIMVAKTINKPILPINNA